MEQSRSRYRLRELIIEEKVSLGLLRKVIEFSVSMFCWCGWIMLWAHHVISYDASEVKDYGLPITVFLFILTILLVLFSLGLYNSFRKKLPMELFVRYSLSKKTKTNVTYRSYLHLVTFLFAP
ncbi:MAG: hypothetical protein CSA42_07250, partial [Gammaproteobacteria bacterium]